MREVCAPKAYRQWAYNAEILLPFFCAAGVFPYRSMPLSPEQIQHLARLARLAVAPEQAAEVRTRLNEVLKLIDELRAVDTAGVEPMAHAVAAQAGAGQRLRADEVTESDRHVEFQAVAPAVERGLYLVPKVIE